MPVKMNETYGRLTIVGIATTKRGRSGWECLCLCGNTKIVEGYRLTNGDTRSCGCLRREVSAARCFKHGRTHSGAWKSWVNMLTRCTNPNSSSYHFYGGRGVTIAPEWMAFENFFADMGERPEGLSLDRIDTYDHYRPGNCRWANTKTQGRNRRGSVLDMETAQEIRQRISAGATRDDLAIEFGVTKSAIQHVIHKRSWHDAETLRWSDPNARLIRLDTP